MYFQKTFAKFTTLDHSSHKFGIKNIEELRYFMSCMFGKGLKTHGTDFVHSVFLTLSFLSLF